MAYSIDEIVQAANDQAERRIDETKLNLRRELFLTIQELLHQNRFWWARKTVTFSTVAGTSEYDLTSATGANAVDVEEIESAFLVESADSNTELQPIFDPVEAAGAYSTTTRAKPARFFMKDGAWQTLKFGAPSDGVYTIRIFYWAGINPSFDEAPTGDAVPVVPGPLHYGLVIGLKRRIMDYLYGQNDNRFIVANAQWERFLKDAARKQSFSAKRQRQFSSGVAVRAF